MIFINKPITEPPKLIEFQTAMTDSIGTYGSLERIPEDESKSFLKGYSHIEVKRILFECNHYKCSYCETIPTGSSLRVDHFFPKKLYPELTLEWDNLLPSCENCNTRKSFHDSKNEPIINPSKINPLPYYDFDYIRMIPAVDVSDQSLIKRTIDICDLNRRELVKFRADLLVELNEYQENIKFVLQDLMNPMSETKIRNRIIKLEESLGTIEEMAGDTKIFSAFIKKFIKRSLEIKEVKIQINYIKKKYENLFN